MVGKTGMSRATALAVICLIIALMVEVHHVAMGWGFWNWNQVIHHETVIIALVTFAGGVLTGKFLTPENA